MSVTGGVVLIDGNVLGLVGGGSAVASSIEPVAVLQSPSDMRRMVEENRARERELLDKLSSGGVVVLLVSAHLWLFALLSCV